MAYIGRDIQYGVLDKQSFTTNGSTTVFALDSGIKDAKSLLVSVGGIIQEPDVAYTASGTTLTFTAAPANGVTTYAIYLGKTLEVASSRDQITFQNETGDGTTTPFTLSATPANAQSIMVTLSGVTQVPNTDYTVSGTTITFITAPVNGTGILVYHLGSTAAIGTINDASVTNAKIVSMDASKLTGTLPSSILNLDTTSIDQTIASLGIHVAVADNKASFNLPGVFIDQFESDTGILTETTVGRDTTGEYVASIYTTDVVTTPASASDWTGDTGSYTITSGGADSTAGDDAIKSNWTSGTGDFTIQLTVTSYSNQTFGVYPVSEDGSFTSDSYGGMSGMTNSWWWTGNGTSQAAKAQYRTYNGYTSLFSDGIRIDDGSVVQIKRVSGTISILIDGTSRHTYSQTSSADLRFVVAHHGTTNGNVQSMTFTALTSSTNATGTLISTASTAPSATTEASGVMVYENSSGTATLGTDLKAYFSADDGANWTEASSYGSAINFNGASKKMVKLGKTTGLTSGTQMKLKAEWANQVATVVGADENQVPEMTSNTAPTGVASADENGANAYKMFDGDSTSNWNAITTGQSHGVHYSGYDFGSGNGIIATSYNLSCNVNSSSGSNQNPNSWTFQASNDNSTWATLDTQSGQASTFPSTSYSTNTYTFSNTTSYRYYRWGWTGAGTVGYQEVYLSNAEIIAATAGVSGKETRLHGWAVNY